MRCLQGLFYYLRINYKCQYESANGCFYFNKINKFHVYKENERIKMVTKGVLRMLYRGLFSFSGVK